MPPDDDLPPPDEPARGAARPAPPSRREWDPAARRTSPGADLPGTLPADRPRGPWRWIAGAAVLVVIGGGWWWQSQRGTGAPPASAGAGPATSPQAAGAPGAPPDAAPAGSGKGRGDRAAGPTPVTAAPATIGALDITLTALGTVTPRSSVTVHPRVDGQLTRVLFTEGQTVKAGQLLALIDPKPFEVQLASAVGQLERDNAQLQNAETDLARYRGLLAQDSIARQQVDTQEALVRQYRGVVAVDQAQVDTARLQLSYTRVIAPTGGRAGLRQVDAGNMVHATDANGIVLITEVQPVDVVFPVPQDQLQRVLARLGGGTGPAGKAAGRAPVFAFDRDGRTRLATGALLTADNQVDATTGTVKLKAEFPNTDNALFPNQFVNIKLVLQTRPDALTVPSAGVQRGAPGLFAYVVRDDGTVAMRPLKLGTTDGDRVEVLEGLAAGERVVTEGTDRLREGARVEVVDPAAARSNSAGGNGRNGKAGERKGGARKRADGQAADGTDAQRPAAPADAAPAGAPSSGGSPPGGSAAGGPPPGAPP